MKTSRLAAVAGAVALTLSMAACGSSDDGDTGSKGDSAAAGFPITIEHKFGSTEIKSQPKRIVTVGLTDQDAVLAMGVVPVATTNWFGDAPGRIFPWADAAAKAAENPLGEGKLPEVLNSEKEFEKVAALKPDLITAIYAGLTQKDYDLLSKIAPVVAAPKGYVDYGTPWQEATTMIGTAMGEKEKAEKMVADVEGQLAKTKADHPEFAGKTAVTVSAYEGIFIYGPEDPRGRFLTDIGFTYPENLKKFSKENFGESISAENAEEVDVDTLVWVNAAKATYDMVPTYKNLRVSKEGRDVFIAEDDDLYIPSSFVTVLSIPYLIEKEVPRLVAAVDGDPSTLTN
ncbi:iron-siderophore ABC transporter substrate-binding protein [Nocardioides marmoriginsengisoli]|uniref:Iron-siderophore ABC transporter substrate-binding protein n=1 Tax=Nocardioides marmoriginsengisoli TaxID=661483 RepID=A0A3N0CLH1_9ACTN|nr:iron-siderophore ABC transporter substrate-binding protein [Nocardioides marmoriginsengisoli]RNL63763.1 iron-siderophore ABC transporter substrate-binding protein [Nocardioides marmoriginsengisoli]